ncbi:MAG: bifunctional folylpolyglutamate synthase/dihydrofolate synthase, partial [Pirellulales bacterium]
ALAEVLARVEAANAGQPITFFEIVTAAAFVAFAEAPADLLVLEVGLGGRFDATNVIPAPAVSVITPVDYDHKEFLGEDLGKIAGEKAGIIKRGCPIVSGAMQPSSRRVIAATAARRRAPLLQLGRDFSAILQPPSTPADVLLGSSFDLQPPGRTAPKRRYRIAMAGRHQVDNAALAVVAALQLDARGMRIGDAAIARGLARTRLPARIEPRGQRPLVIVDAAHNVASMRSLLETLDPVLRAHKPRALVFAASDDKQIELMLASAAGRFSHVIVTRYQRNPRASSVERLVAACITARLPTPEVAATPAEAVALARSRVGTRGIIVIAGSFFLAAEVGIGLPPGRGR